MPWFLLDDGGSEQFFGGLLWPGAWSAHFERQSTSTHATFGLTSFSTTVGPTPLDTPHGYVGLTDNTAKSVGEATRVFINSAVRHGRSYSPLVTYNTWFAYGTDINEASMIHEMDAAADLGVELFVVDAGWYRAGKQSGGFHDWYRGVGGRPRSVSIRPVGVQQITRTHLGMKFGIWVEPQRVDLRDGRQSGPGPRAVAGNPVRPVRSREDQRPPRIPLSSAWRAPRRASRFLVASSALIDAAHPDYLKWDNNFWVNCTRSRTRSQLR